MRLFAGVWPPPEVVHMLAGLPRPVSPGVRWTTPAQWHVTLAFLGEVPDEVVPEVGAALVDATARVAATPVAVLGPASSILGTGVLCAPVAGLEGLAAAVADGVGAATGAGEAARCHRGHVTLARSGRRPMPAGLAGAPVAASWAVVEVVLVRSELAPGGARYSTIATATVRS